MVTEYAVTPEGGSNTPTVREPDGVHCRFCGADPGTVPVGGNEYRAFWEIHESRAHKLERIRACAGVRPHDEVLAALLNELMSEKV
ncbi:MAG: hypothetical protein ACYDHE_17085 [Candidatus Acidiferrales bacterium]